MEQKRVVSIQDISCLGQCSMAVALPILAVCGIECCMMPTMILSTHTGGLGTPHRRDLSADILPTAAHWHSQHLLFDGVCVGYLGTAGLAARVMQAVGKLLAPGGKLIVDPAMADGGRLYGGIDLRYVEEIQALCRRADVILPNLTEGYLLAGLPYCPQPTEQQLEALLTALEREYGGTVVLTGAAQEPGLTGFALRDSGKTAYYRHPLVGGSYHGTGDQFAAVFAAAYLRGKSAFDSAVLAAEFVSRVAVATAQAPAHHYGTRFEAVLPWLAQQFS